jgi:copper chaperone CopZ
VAGRDAAGERVATTHSASRDGITGSSATLVVYGMRCPLCASNVEQQLQAVPGVTGVTIDMSTGETKLTLDGSNRTTRKMLADAIKRSGFTLKEVRIP